MKKQNLLILFGNYFGGCVYFRGRQDIGICIESYNHSHYRSSHGGPKQGLLAKRMCNRGGNSSRV